MVTYASPYVLLRAVGFFGTTAVPVDEWSVGWKLAAPPGTTVSAAELLSLAEGLRDEVQTFHANGSIAAGTNCFLRALTSAFVGTDGRYVGGGAQETTISLYPTPIAGAGTTNHAYSTAIAITHFSEFGRGKASRGRVYWPATSLGIVPTTGAIATGTQNGINTAYRTLVDGINTQAQAVFAWNALVSIVGAESVTQEGPSPARSASVIAVGTGVNPDTQRRRDSSIAENHVALNLNTVSGLLEQLRDRQHRHLPA